MNSPKQQIVRIKGMHCAACEILIERAWQQLPGVRSVKVKRSRQCGYLTVDQNIPVEELQKVIHADGYSVEAAGEKRVLEKVARSAADRWTEIGAILLIFGALYLAAKGF